MATQKAVSEIDQLVAIAEGKGRASYDGMLKGLSVRVPMSLYASVATLAEMGGTSMNIVFLKLVTAGIEEVERTLSREGKKRYDRLRAAQVERLFEDVEVTSGGL